MSSASPELVVAEVAALLERRRTAQAKARLKEALQQHPDHPGLLLQSAWADFADGNNDAALTTVRQVLAHEPDSDSGRHLLFELQLERKAYAEAEQVILQLLRSHPEHAPYHGRYAELLVRTMNLAKARAVSEEGLKYDPDDLGCLAARTLCDFIEQRQGATSHSLQQLLVRHPQSMRTLLMILMALEDRGDYDGALRIAQELVRAEPDNASLVEAAVELKAATHWSAWPLWPLRRWGWGGSIALWIGGIVCVQLVARVNPVAAGILAICIIGYAVYSWVWPPLLKRLIART